jgi:hypothetical protein
MADGSYGAFLVRPSGTGTCPVQRKLITAGKSKVFATHLVVVCPLVVEGCGVEDRGPGSLELFKKTFCEMTVPENKYKCYSFCGMVLQISK